MPLAFAAATTLSMHRHNEWRASMTAGFIRTEVFETSGARVHGSLAVLPELVVDAVGSRDIVESPEIAWVRNPAHMS